MRTHEAMGVRASEGGGATRTPAAPIRRKFAATGDPFQNPPIELSPLCVPDRMAYYLDAVSSLFPNQLTLKVCKRVSTAGEQARLESIKRELFAERRRPFDVIKRYATPVSALEGVRGTAVCYRNATAAAINTPGPR